MNGLIRDGGECLRFKLPVLVLGSGTAADVSVPGTAELHCLVAPTPMGPALRAFEPTSVNGVPTVAALLKHGDVLTVGESTFTIAWSVEANLESALLAERKAQIETLLTQLHDERDAFRQETASTKLELAAIDERSGAVNARQEQVEAMLAQFQRERDAFREEKAAAKDKLAAIDDRHREAAEIQEKARAAAAKYLKTQRAAIQAERQSHSKLQHEVELQKKQISEAMAALVAEQERFRQEADATNERLATAWATMNATQTRLTAEREQSDAQIRLYLQMIETQKAELAKREQAIGGSEQAATAKLANLESEIAGLEQRAAHARMVVADLERQRQMKTVAEEPAGVKVGGSWNDPVPLVIKHDNRSADQLIMQLRQQEAEVARERQRLEVALQNAAIEKEQLNDQRLMVAEQVRQIEVARRQWQQNETQTLGELESLAKSLAHRESELDHRAAAIMSTEAERRGREEQLAHTRKSVEAWQAALTQREARFATEHKHAEADIAKRKDALAKREAEVGQFFAQWDHRYAEACATLHDDVSHFAEIKDLYIASAADCAKTRDAALKDVQRLTAKKIAVDEAKAVLVKEHGPHARRLIRVSRRRWEKKLEAQLVGVKEKKSALEAALANAGDRLLRMQRSIGSVADQRASQFAFERGHDLAMLKEPVILPFARAKQDEEIIPLQRAA